MERHFDPVTLSLFLAVCEEGSMVRCAEREAIVASAVSKRMAALEEDLGIALLQRGPRGMVPTEAGAAFARQAREVLVGMERMHANMSEMAKGGGGTVSILAGMAVLSTSLPADLARFLARHRRVRASLKESRTPETVRRVREGSADLGVCWDAADLSGLESVPYRTDHACVLVPAGHALARRKSLRFEETLDYESVSAMSGSMMEIMLRRYAAMLGRTLAPSIEVQSFEGVCRIVAAGLGICVLPREVVGPTTQALGLRLIPLQEEWARRQFVICFRAGVYVSAPARLLVDHLHRAAMANEAV